MCKIEFEKNRIKLLEEEDEENSKTVKFKREQVDQE